MNGLLNYMIEANLGLIFFCFVYFLLFHRETQFTVKRAYLLGAMLAPVVFPLIEFNSTQSLIPSMSVLIPVIYLPEVVINGTHATTASVITNYWNLASGIYGLVAGILLLSFFTRVGKLVFYLRSNAFVREGKFRIHESTADHRAFSFFRYIFIGNVNNLDHSEKEHIINHEKLHASRMHSLDLLLTEALKIIFWFNPVVYILKNQLVSIHEFEADQHAVRHQDADHYCELLAHGSLVSAGFSLANHFHNSLTLKRIVMINSKKTKMKSWKYFMLIPAFSMGFFLVSCQDQVKSDFSDSVRSSTEGNVPTEISDKVKQLQKTNPEREYIIAEVSEGGVKSFDDATNSVDKSKSEIISISRFDATKNSKGEIRKFIVIEKGTTADAQRSKSKSGVSNESNSSTITKGKIYAAVQQNPTFPGGLTALGEYISKELKYPSQAMRMGVQGKVFVQFVVDQDGRVSDVSVVQGIGAGCDAEAARVIANSPKWNPGKQDGVAVSVQYVVPINFIL